MFRGLNSSFAAMTNNLVRLGVELQNSNTRLSTGKRINKAADDPAGLIAATRLNQEITALDSRISSAERLKSVVDTADGAASEISTLLTDIESAVLASADSGTTDAEKAAYQAEIDDAIGAIDRLVSTTTYGGKKLLDGSMGYNVSGSDSSEISDIRVQRASSTAPAAISITKSRTETAAALEIMTAAPTGAVQFTVTGNDGTSTAFNFDETDSLNDIASVIGAQTGSTGVDAVVSGGSLYLASSGIGRDEFVSVNISSGESDFAITGTSASEYGATTDTVVVNGRTLTQDEEGSYTYSDSQTTVSFNLVDSFTGSTSFAVNGGGAGWSIGGDEIKLGINDMSSSKLGNVNLGYLSSLKSGGANDISSGNATTAQSIVTEAQNMVNTQRGNLGAVSKYTIESAMNSWETTKGYLSEAYGSIMDLDYAKESANNSRIESLLSVQTQVMGNMFNFTSNMVSKLLDL
ncbi:MAG: hypothetical protein JW745_02240 [Sedimentisphaerales bacterium]|nr:hypothetical protein [Sedimentisphaerales bacterium]MBN2841860.1 hypothetical protein [Sedimentisphaerales bacterium]